MSFYNINFCSIISLSVSCSSESILSDRHFFSQLPPVIIFPLLAISNSSRVNSGQKGKVKPLTIFAKTIFGPFSIFAKTIFVSLLDSDLFEFNQNPNVIMIFYQNCRLLCRPSVL